LRPRALLLLLSVLAVPACEFGEIEIPDGDPIVVVTAVMRPDLGRQWVLVEQTLTGAFVDSTIVGLIPGNAPQLPVAGATVRVTNLSFTGDPCGTTMFSESPAAPELARAPGLYWGPPDCPTMRAGDTLALLVETAGGETVTGRTIIPGASSMVLRAGADSVRLPGAALEFNRDVDTLEAEITPIGGRALQLEVWRPDSAGEPQPVSRLFVDSTVMTVPGDLSDFLERLLGEQDTSDVEEAEPIFRAGRYHSVVLALMDERYFDFVRSNNVPISGRGFINNLDGGMGVFGSLVAEQNLLRVIGDIDDSREGTYRMAGTVDGQAVDVTLELYAAATAVDSTDVSAFVGGQWFYGAIDAGADGFFRGDELALTIYQPDPSDPGVVSAFVVAGSLGTSTTASADVFDRELRSVGALTVTKLGGS
jgi:hypothetical protein